MNESKPITVISNCSWREIKGSVVTLLSSGECKVFKENDCLHICIGDVMYILKPGMDVVLQSTEDRTVIVFQGDGSGTMFGLDTQNLDEIDAFKLILNDWIRKEEVKKPRVSIYGEMLSSSIAKFGKHGVSAISRAKSLTIKGIDIIAEKSKQKVSKMESPMHISEKTKANIGSTKAATNVAVMVSSSMMKGGLESAQKITNEIKPLVKNYMKEKGILSDKPVGPKSKAAIDVGKQSMKTGLELFIAMKEAARAVMFHTMDASADMVDHRYGEDAGNVAKDVSRSLQNTLEITSNIGQLGIAKTAKKMALDGINEESVKDDVSEEIGVAPSDRITVVPDDVKQHCGEASNVYDMD